MGVGYEFKCKKCKKDYSVFLGTGMLMPTVYEETVDEIKQGVWGDDYKEIFHNDPLIAPDIEEELYLCRSCGKWSVEKNMNLYAPNDPESVLRQYGIHTVDELGQAPFVMRCDLEEEYHLVKRRIHYCECGKRMHKASDREARSLPCPYCGTINPAEKDILWD